MRLSTISPILLAFGVALFFSCAPPAPPTRPEPGVEITQPDFYFFSPFKPPENPDQKPLDGIFTIVDIRPYYSANGYIKTIDFIIDANSKQPWSVGDFGHPNHGSLWLELSITNKVWKNNRAEDELHAEIFSITGIAPGTSAFVAPSIGTQYPAGKSRIHLRVSPHSRIKLSGVEQKFELGFFSCHDYGCWHDYPEIMVKLHIFSVSSGNMMGQVQTATKNIENAPLQKVKVAKKTGGIVYYPCKEETCYPNCDYDLAATGVCYWVNENIGKITFHGIIENLGKKTVEFPIQPPKDSLSGSHTLGVRVGSRQYSQPSNFPIGFILKPNEKTTTPVSLEYNYNQDAKYGDLELQVVLDQDQNRSNDYYHEFPNKVVTGLELKQMQYQYECPSPW